MKARLARLFALKRGPGAGTHVPALIVSLTASLKGIFLWRDCPSGEWQLRTAAGGGSAVHAATVTSSANYVSVKAVSLSSEDRLNFTADPKQIKFRFDTRGADTDRVNFLPQERASACIRIDAPSGARVFYGPFRKPITAPFNLETQASCSG